MQSSKSASCASKNCFCAAVEIGSRSKPECVQSGLYRVTYVGRESTAPVLVSPTDNPARTLRHQLEAFHGRQDPEAVDFAWKHLSSPDRFIRWTARTALEHQPTATWADRALAERNPLARVEALLTLTRASGTCVEHRTAASPAPDAPLGRRIIRALDETDWPALDAAGRLGLLRTLQIALHRFEPADHATTPELIAKLEPLFPTSDRELNWLLCETLTYLQSPTVAAKAVALMARAPAQEEQIEYARSLRMLKSGWPLAARTAYFEWFLKAANYRGGASLAKFIEFIRNDALKTLAPSEQIALADVLGKKPTPMNAIENLGAIFSGRPFTNWTLEELSAAAATGMQGRTFETGREMFGAAACFACHRFGNEGGMTGPDLSTAGARYSPADFLDQIINPSKVINEQFVPTVLTKNNGETITGVVVNLLGDFVTINEEPSDPNQNVTVDRKEVQSIEPSQISTMPPMLLSRLYKEEVLDLVAYVLSGGDPAHEMFRK